MCCALERVAVRAAGDGGLFISVLWIAMLGGYLNRKHDLPPGPTVIWRGFLLLHEITKIYQLFRQIE